MKDILGSINVYDMPRDTITLKINGKSYDISLKSKNADYYLAKKQLDDIFIGKNYQKTLDALEFFAGEVWIEYILQNFNKIFEAGYSIDDFRDPDDPEFTTDAAADAVMKVLKPKASWYINDERVKSPFNIDFYKVASIYFGDNDLDVDELLSMIE